MKRSSAILLAIALQILVPAWMAGERELIVQTGHTLYLRTIPVDPRDPFRGDYVRLNYEISSLPRRLLTDLPLDQRTVPRDTHVYTQLVLDPEGLARPTRISLAPPAQGTFLHGWTATDWYFGAAQRGGLTIRYGIEKYFVEQGRGRLIEQRRDGRQSVRVPMEVRVAVSRGGTGVITGHRWGPLGIGLTMERLPRPAPGQPVPSAILRLTLQNVSDAPLTLVLLPDLCSFHLLSTADAPRDLSLSRPECASQAPGPDTLVTLAPNADRTFRIDFNEPRWRVFLDGAPTLIGDLPWDQRFRLVYRSSWPAAQLAPPDLWQGELPSRSFHGRGRVD
jgi:uncharacterized membrane-anchored protein